MHSKQLIDNLTDDALSLANAICKKYGITAELAAKNLQKLSNKKSNEIDGFEYTIQDLVDDAIGKVAKLVRIEGALSQQTERTVLTHISGLIWVTVLLCRIDSSKGNSDFSKGFFWGDLLRRLMFAIQYPSLLKEFNSDKGSQAVNIRHENNHIVRDYAWILYGLERPKYKTKTAAIENIFSKVQEISVIYKLNLSGSRGQKTISDWILKYEKEEYKL